MNPIISFFRRKILRIPADRWDYQYAHGEWDSLSEENERLRTLTRTIHKRHPVPSILEIGCGKAVLLQQLAREGFASYTGVDLSKVAIAEAKKFSSADVRFIQADMQTFVPDGKYDVIAFNESLYYARQVSATFARFIPHLNTGGCIVVSAFRNKYTAHLWPAIEQKWQPAMTEEVRKGDLVWVIKVYEPS